jgi:hypothetical protein
MTPLGTAATVGKTGGSPAFGIGTPPARNGAPLPMGTGIFGGVANGVGKLLAIEVAWLTSEVRALLAERAAGRFPVPLPSAFTQPLTTPT